MKLSDTQALQHRLLHVNKVFNGDYRKVQAVRLSGIGVDTGRAGGDHIRIVGIEVGQTIHADNKILVSIDGFARTNNSVPIAWCCVIGMIFTGRMGVSRKIMRNQYHIIFRLIEFAVAFPANLQRLDSSAANGCVRRHAKAFFAGE